MATNLPNPPWRVLATKGLEPRWWLIHEGPPGDLFLEESTYEDLMERDKLGTLKGSQIASAAELTVLPHPRNDPEAVEIINRAKERSDGP